MQNINHTVINIIDTVFVKSVTIDGKDFASQFLDFPEKNILKS